jgi:phosphate transport system protein
LAETLFERRKEGLLNKALLQAGKMLEEEIGMFLLATDSILGKKVAEGEVEERDKGINLGEKEIRRMIVAHLALNPEYDLPVSLALMSVVVDIERIGDFTKSIVELGKISRERLLSGKYADYCLKLREQLVQLFQLTIDAFLKEDIEKGRKVMVTCPMVKEESERIVHEVMEDEGASAGIGATVSLLFWYFRRIAAHLSNVASAVVKPVDEIGFDDES